MRLTKETRSFSHSCISLLTQKLRILFKSFCIFSKHANFTGILLIGGPLSWVLLDSATQSLLLLRTYMRPYAKSLLTSKFTRRCQVYSPKRSRADAHLTCSEPQLGYSVTLVSEATQFTKMTRAVLFALLVHLIVFGRSFLIF